MLWHLGTAGLGETHVLPEGTGTSPTDAELSTRSVNIAEINFKGIKWRWSVHIWIPENSLHTTD